MVLLVLWGNIKAVTNLWTKSEWKKEERPLDIGVESEKVHKRMSVLWFLPKNPRL